MAAARPENAAVGRVLRLESWTAYTQGAVSKQHKNEGR